MIIAGDVGGTKTILGIYTREEGSRSPLALKTFTSADFENLEQLCSRFLDTVDRPVEHAVLGVAGPVVGGQAKATNLAWEIDEHRLTEALGLDRVTLLNDLVALTHAIPALQPNEVVEICRGQPEEGGNIAVLAPGTGLGEAYATRRGRELVAQPSEGGHTDFGPRTDLQRRLLAHLSDRCDHVSYERVCSGLGLPDIYDFLKHEGVAPEPDWLTKALTEVEDRTPVIVEAALDDKKPCALCERTLDLFVAILASEAANLALTVFASGGVFLGGGIPPKILPALKSQTFRESFRSKGRMSYWLKRVPVRVIMNTQAPLLGAAEKGLASLPSLPGTEDHAV